MKKKNLTLIMILLFTMLLNVSNGFSFSFFGNEHIKKAKGFINANMYEDAILVLNEEIKGSDKHEANPTNAEAHFLLGKIYVLQGKIPMARERFASAKNLDSKYGPIIGKDLILIADGKMKDKKFVQAGILYEEAVYNDPNLKRKIAPKQYELGIIFANRGDVDSAEKNFENASQSDPGLAPKIALEYKKAAQAHLKKGDLSTALQLYENAVRQNQDLKNEIAEELFNYGNEKNSDHAIALAAEVNPKLKEKIKDACRSQIENLAGKQLLNLSWDTKKCGKLSDTQKEQIGNKLLAEGSRQKSEDKKEIYLKEAIAYIGEEAVLESLLKHYTSLWGKPEDKTLSSNAYVEIKKVKTGDVVYFLSLESIRIKCGKAEMTWGKAVTRIGIIEIIEANNDTPLHISKYEKNTKVYYWKK